MTTSTGTGGFNPRDKHSRDNTRDREWSDHHGRRPYNSTLHSRLPPLRHSPPPLPSLSQRNGIPLRAPPPSRYWDSRDRDRDRDHRDWERDRLGDRDRDRIWERDRDLHDRDLRERDRAWERERDGRDRDRDWVDRERDWADRERDTRPHPSSYSTGRLPPPPSSASSGRYRSPPPSTQNQSPPLPASASAAPPSAPLRDRLDPTSRYASPRSRLPPPPPNAPGPSSSRPREYSRDAGWGSKALTVGDSGRNTDSRGSVSSTTAGPPRSSESRSDSVSVSGESGSVGQHQTQREPADGPSRARSASLSRKRSRQERDSEDEAETERAAVWRSRPSSPDRSRRASATEPLKTTDQDDAASRSRSVRMSPVPPPVPTIPARFLSGDKQPQHVQSQSRSRSSSPNASKQMSSTVENRDLPSEEERLRRRRRHDRSYSPGEISEGGTRSPSPTLSAEKQRSGSATPPLPNRPLAHEPVLASRDDAAGRAETGVSTVDLVTPLPLPEPRSLQPSPTSDRDRTTEISVLDRQDEPSAKASSPQLPVSVKSSVSPKQQDHSIISEPQVKSEVEATTPPRSQPHALSGSDAAPLRTAMDHGGTGEAEDVPDDKQVEVREVVSVQASQEDGLSTTTLEAQPAAQLDLPAAVHKASPEPPSSLQVDMVQVKPATPPQPVLSSAHAAAETETAGMSSPLSQLAPTSPPKPVSSPIKHDAGPVSTAAAQPSVSDDRMDMDVEQTATPAAAEPIKDDEDGRETTGGVPQMNAGEPWTTYPSVPRDFASVLDSVIASNNVDSGEANAVLLSNREKTAKERSFVDRAVRDAALDKAFSIDWDSHSRLRCFLLDEFAQRDDRRGHKMLELRGQYKLLHSDWRAHCKRLDRIKERIVKRNQPTSMPQTPSIDSAGLPFYPEPVTPGPALGLGSARANRRGANTAFGYGDAVRSEAEFLEILASLETADMRDPTVRATRTAAVVPDMVVDDAERRELSAIDDETRRVNDPVEFFGIDQPLDLWTEDEVQVFCKRFAQFPKQFGKISAELPHKTTAQCVLFYYRMKTTIDFRGLSDRRGRDGRRRKPKKRTMLDMGLGGAGAGAAGGATSSGSASGKKGTSLLADLKRANQVDEDDDDSPPPSPQTARRSLPAETSSVFQPPPSTSARPPATAADGQQSTVAGLGPPVVLDNSAEGDVDDSAFYFSPLPSSHQPLPKTTRTPKSRDHALLPSDGMLEAAEALGALVGGFNDGGPGDDGEESKSKASGGAAKAKRRSNTSSYWSVAERNELVRLLSLHGKDWAKLAAGMQNKTAVQCRNWYHSNAKKLNLAEIVESAGDETDGTMSVLATPGSEFTAPLGVPLSESLAASGMALPRTGFFLTEGSSRSEAEDKVAKAGMQIRNLLNDDTHSEEAHTPARDDWFNAPIDETGSVTTEDEGDTPAALPKNDSEFFPSSARSQDAFAGFQATRRRSDDAVQGRRGSSSTSSSVFSHPLPPTQFSTAYPQHGHLRQALPSPLTAPTWQSTPLGTPSTAYPSPAGGSVATTPMEHYRPADPRRSAADSSVYSSARGSRPGGGSVSQPNDYFNSEHHPPPRQPHPHVSNTVSAPSSSTLYARTSAYPPPRAPSTPRPSTVSSDAGSLSAIDSVVRPQQDSHVSHEHPTASRPMSSSSTPAWHH